jgi:ketosteroid isomerase-like protein
VILKEIELIRLSHFKKKVFVIYTLNLKIMNRNITVVNKIYEAFGKGDVPTIMDYLSENVKWEQWENNYAQKAGVPWLQERKGKDGALDFFKIVGEFIFKDFRVLSVMGNDNQVAAEILLEIEIPSSGTHMREEEIHLWTFNELGKVVRFRHYADTAKHIAAAKVAEHFSI